MSYAALYRWHDGTLVPIDYCDPSEYAIEVADSWLVSEGAAFALGLHKARFAHGAALRGFTDLKTKKFLALGEPPRTVAAAVLFPVAFWSVAASRTRARFSERLQTGP